MRYSLKKIEIRHNSKKIYDIILDNSFGHLQNKLIEIGLSGRKV